ncbi:MAG: hypothetical protein WCO66_01420 [Candidatus Absconditabacteria bacterium]
MTTLPLDILFADTSKESHTGLREIIVSIKNILKESFILSYGSRSDFTPRCNRQGILECQRCKSANECDLHALGTVFQRKQKEQERLEEQDKLREQKKLEEQTTEKEEISKEENTNKQITVLENSIRDLENLLDQSSSLLEKIKKNLKDA